MALAPDVRIKQGNIWFNANDMQIKAYQNYKKRYVERPLTTTFHVYGDGTYYEVIESQIPTSAPDPSHVSLNTSLVIVKMVSITIIRTNNNCYMPTYITEKIIDYIPSQEMQQNNELPIIDWNDIKLFLINTYMPTNWYNARSYQTWAYIDFMYDNKEVKYYASRGSYVNDDEDVEVPVGRIQYTIIDIDNVSPNIIFSIKRNSNNSVSFVRENNQNVRICDDERARAGYRGYYTRMTMDLDIIITPPAPIPTPTPIHHIIPSTIIAIETDIENDQCILCCKYKKNICFTPCNHNIICSCCYIKLDKGGRECPICKGTINNVTFI
jgi:hypothetical protein